MSVLPRRLRGRTALGTLALAVSTCVHAQRVPLPTASEWGDIGLLQTPTGRMADEGELAFTASHNAPYARYTMTMQPYPWLEGAFRYINVSNRLYGPAIAGRQSYKDKSIDFKVRLWREGRYLPQLALGVRDLGGTGLFSSEYLVASKRFGPVDASVGVATGYLGNRGDFANPLGWIDERFKTRPGSSGQAGDFNARAMFRGRVGVFGGLAYQTPWQPLQLKLEYDGNDYRHEPKNNNLRQRTPLNVGAVYSLNRNVQITAAWERGDAAMVALTLRGNPGYAATAPKPLDPPPERLRHLDQESRRADTAAIAAGASAVPPDWAEVARRLHDNAGLLVQSISRRGQELVVTGQQLRYFDGAQGLGRAARILDNSAPDDIGWFTVANVRLGMPIAESSVARMPFRDYVDHRIDLETLRPGIELDRARPPGQVLYEAPLQHFGGGFDLGYRQNLGGPDGFILYQVSANYSGSWFFSRNLWLSGMASANLLNNYDKFKYDAPSNMPRVRTDLRRYMTTSEFTLPNLQLTAAGQLGRDLYGMAYAGYLEWMYAGAGGEVLYRPWGERWALGVNANWVRQRAFDQHFGLRGYQVGTGHATFYYAFGQQQRTLASLSAGRYLAGDWGATLDVARIFPNGMTMGAYVTKTNVSSAEFGEGSFDKGIYFSIPFDSLLPRSTRARGTFTWNPLIRDGGAMLGRKYALYPITGERNEWFFYENLDKMDR